MTEERHGYPSTEIPEQQAARAGKSFADKIFPGLIVPEDQRDVNSSFLQPYGQSVGASFVQRMVGQIQENTILEMQRRGILDDPSHEKAFDVAIAYLQLFNALEAAGLGISRPPTIDVHGNASPSPSRSSNPTGR